MLSEKELNELIIENSIKEESMTPEQIVPRRNDFVSEFGRRAVTECGSRCGYRLFSSLRISPLSSAICAATPNLSDRDRRRRPQTFAPQVDRLKLTLPILIVLFRDERIMKRIPVIIF